MELVENPEQYKTLKYVHGRYKRVHLDPYILLFTVEGNRVAFLVLAHDDTASER